jgi:hypothetical protein
MTVGSGLHNIHGFLPERQKFTTIGHPELDIPILKQANAHAKLQ